MRALQIHGRDQRSTRRAVILTALPVEFQAIVAHLTDAREELHPQGTVYTRGRFADVDWAWDVAVAQIGAHNDRAALEAERAVSYFDPHALLFVGVAGGLKDVRLGDVVAATDVYGYESGKAARSFEPRADVGSSSYRLIQRALAEATKDDWLRRIQGPRPNPAPTVHVGPIAAGAKVVASTRSATYRFLRRNYGAALAVEMEGRGFLRAAHANDQVLALVVRGISDLIERKSEADAAGSQETAAQNASAFAFEVLAKLRDGTTKTTSTQANPSVSVEEVEHTNASEQSLPLDGADGEHKYVTVLFTAISHSPSVPRGLDPDASASALDAVLQLLTDVVERYGGRVRSTSGNDFIALFGAPTAIEDHALRACHAALDIQAAMRRRTDHIRGTTAASIQARVGLDSGVMTIRTVDLGSGPQSRDTGDAAQMAQLILHRAPPGAVVLTQTTLGLTQDFIRVRSLGHRVVGTDSETIEMFQLDEVRYRRSPLEAKAARGLTPLAGRDDQLATVRAVQDMAKSGRGQSLSIVGEPGIGKSRLAWEIIQSQAASGCRKLLTTAVSYERNTPYFVIANLLREYLGLSPDTIVGNLETWLRPKVADLAASVPLIQPAILSLLDTENTDEVWGRLDTTQRRRSIIDSVVSLFQYESTIQPVLILIEDLHWIDSESLVVLDAIAFSLEFSRILLILNHRKEFSYESQTRSNHTKILLQHLSVEDSTSMISFLLRQFDLHQLMDRRLFENCDGNPFFIEEVIRNASEQVSSLIRKGVKISDIHICDIDIPNNIRSVLQSRIDRLPTKLKSILKVASVLGKTIDLSILKDITGYSNEQLRSYLEGLQHGDFVYQTRWFPNPEYTFRHALTQEVAYKSFRSKRRREIHTRIVRAMEDKVDTALETSVEQLALHTFKGRIWERATMYGCRAGHKAVSQLAHREAANHFERALSAIQQLPTTRDRQIEAIEIRFQLRTALIPLGDNDGLLRHLREAEGVARSLGDELRGGLAAAHIAASLWNLAQHDSAIDSGNRALAHASRVGSRELAIAANVNLAYAYRDKGDYTSAIQRMRSNISLIPDGQEGESFGLASKPAITGRAQLAWCLAELGEFGPATQWAEDAMRIASQVEHRYSLIYAHINLGGVYLVQREALRAIPDLEAGLRLCRDSDIRRLMLATTARLGLAYALARRMTNGLELLQEALELAGQWGLPAEQSLHTTWLSEGYLLAGDLDRAAGLAKQAHDQAAANGEQGYEAHALRMLGDVAAKQNTPDVDAAERSYSQALSLSMALQMRPLAALCRLGLGDVYRRMGLPNEAASELVVAVKEFNALQMRGACGQAEMSLASVRGAQHRQKSPPEAPSTSNGLPDRQNWR